MKHYLPAILMTISVLSCAGTPRPGEPLTLRDSWDGVLGGLSLVLIENPGALVALTLENSGPDGTRFSSYYPDTLTAKLKERHPEVQVVERPVLEKVLEERGLRYRGFMDSAEVLELKDLTPAQYILTGSYTVLDSTVELNLRLVDVRDGTLAMSRSLRIILDPDLRLLLGMEPKKDLGSLMGRMESKLVNSVEKVVDILP